MFRDSRTVFALFRGFSRGGALPPSWKRSPNISKVMVCVGDSNYEASAGALRAACELSSTWSQGSPVNVQSVYIPGVPNWARDPKLSSFVDSIQGMAKEYNQSSEHPSVHVDVDVTDAGRPVKDAVIRAVNSGMPDLCVVGAGGGTHSTRLFSLVEHVSRKAPCDVLIVREKSDTTTTSGHSSKLWEGPMKILVCFGVNDWEGSLEALRSAIRLARPGDSIEAVHVPYIPADGAHGPPPSFVVPRGDGTVEQKIESALRDALATACDEPSVSCSPDMSFIPTVLPPTANPMISLIEHATKCGADVVAVGSGGATHLFHPSSFSYYLSHNSPCSVLVARHAATPAVDKPASAATADVGVELRTVPRSSSSGCAGVAGGNDGRPTGWGERDNGTDNPQSSTAKRRYIVEDPREWLRYNTFI